MNLFHPKRKGESFDRSQESVAGEKNLGRRAPVNGPRSHHDSVECGFDNHYESTPGWNGLTSTRFGLPSRSAA